MSNRNTRGNPMSFYFIAAVAALGGLLFGYDTGVISGALIFIRHVMLLSTTMQGVVVAIALAGATIGAAVVGYLSDRAGRRRVILGAGLLFIAGAGISAVAQGVAVLVVGRFLVGLAIGVASMLTPLYLAEIAPASDRGAIVSLNQLCITAGILVSYLVGYALAGATGGWRWMLALGAVPGIILSVGMLVLPESPRWLAGHGRIFEAESVLQRLRGTADVSQELGTLRRDIARENRKLTSAWELLSPRLRRPLIIGVGLAMFQQITGINTVIYFAPIIFQSAGLSSAATSILATAGVGAVNVIMTIVSIWLIDRLGRRQLLYWSLGGMTVTLFVLSYAFLGGTSGELAWVAVLSVAAYVGFFAIGLGPVFWLLIAEIFPLALRGRAMSLATVANWGFNLIVSATFLNLVGAFGSTGAFLVYGVLSLAALAFVAVTVPETKGRTLEQIEAALDAGAPQPAPVQVSSM
ncbi:MAG TPA: sugar porter family MFS transporter [Acetobacteraceae bacterium]|nr:sugar porter family MFS transporter [Acetobacteraceae bacterium]